MAASIQYFSVRTKYKSAPEESLLHGRSKFRHFSSSIFPLFFSPAESKR